MRRLQPARVAFAAALATTLVAGDAGARTPGLCAAVAAHRSAKAYVAVLSAFPAEAAPIVAHMTFRERIEIGGRTFYLGELAGMRVVVGLMGIGTVNAATTTESLLSSRLHVAAIVVSGVAGSPLPIGDVAAPAVWRETASGAVHATNPVLYELARELAGTLALDHCTPVPPPDGPTVCIPAALDVVPGGTGETDDPYRGQAFQCTPGGDDVLGCDLPEPAVRIATAATDAVVTDQETGAMARIATDHGVPFVAFRAVSDNVNFAQFPNYYPLAARNAATATIAMLGRLSSALGGRGHASLCRLLAHRRWDRAARRVAARKRQPARRQYVLDASGALAVDVDQRRTS
jgi:adenosylhomocysteine nucleosidase